MRQGRRSAVRRALKSFLSRQPSSSVVALVRVPRLAGRQQSQRLLRQHPLHFPPRHPVGQRVTQVRKAASRQQLPMARQAVRAAVLNRDQSRPQQGRAPVSRRDLRSDRSPNRRQIMNPAMSPVTPIPGVPHRRGKSRIPTPPRRMERRRLGAEKMWAAAT